MSMPGCPPVSVIQGQVVNIDYADFVVHHGRHYSARTDISETFTPEQVGAEVFRVTCSFSALNELTQSELPEPTEHSAAFIPARSAVYTATGWPEACRLVAQHEGNWVVYVATIDTPDASTFDECGLDPARWTTDRRS